jgi:serine/threonine protein kinase
MTSSSSDRNPVEALAEEFLERFRRGERPALSEYTGKFPELASQIRDLFPALVMLEDVRPASRGEAEGGPAPAEGKRLERLGDYRILREVGRGGMGIVYEAEQESLGRHVALKVLPAHTLLDPRQLQRFQREARAAARLHHTNIVPVFDVGESDGLHYYAMQLIHGQGLDQVLAELLRLHKHSVGAVSEPAENPKAPAHRDTDAASALAVAQALLTGVFSMPGSAGQEGARPGAPAVSSSSVHLPGQKDSARLSSSGRAYWESVARIGIQVAEALAYAHALGTLHRDIKPSNLLLDTQGIVWVTDFGLAKGSDSENLTHTGDVVGTLRYMAPERFQGKTDGRSDLYSLGLTLYELLTLRPAFDASERSKLLHQVLHEEPPRPRKLNPAVPRDLETIVVKAIARDPAHRYQGAAELAEDLRRFTEDQPIRARPVSEAEKMWRWCRRNPTLAGALALVVLTATAAFLWVNHEKDTARWLASENGRLAGEESLARQQVQDALAKKTEAFKARDAAARRAQAVNDYLIRDMLRSADPHRSQGQSLTVRQVLDRAAAGVAQRFAGEPDLEEAVREELASAYLNVGQPREALTQLNARVDLCRRLHGETDPFTLVARAERITALGYCYEYAAVVKESAALLPELRQALGVEHKLTLRLLEEAARSHRALGQAAEARTLFEELVAVQQCVQGPEGEATLQAQAELANALLLLGKSEEALRLCEEHLSLSRRAHGPEHMSTLMLRNQRALCLTARGRLGEAEKECTELLPLLRSVAGPEHLETLGLINNQAGVLTLRQRHGEACKLFEECLPGLRRLLGEDNVEVVRASILYGTCLGSAGRLAEAEALFDRVGPVLHRLPASDSGLLVAQTQYGLVLLKLGKLAKAEPAWREVAELRRQKLGRGHWLIGEAETMLGVCLVGQGRYAEAEPVLLSGHKTMASAWFPPAPAATIGLARQTLATLYDRWGKPEQAAAWRTPGSTPQ